MMNLFLTFYICIYNNVYIQVYKIKQGLNVVKQFSHYNSLTQLTKETKTSLNII